MAAIGLFVSFKWTEVLRLSENGVDSFACLFVFIFNDQYSIFFSDIH